MMFFKPLTKGEIATARFYLQNRHEEIRRAYLEAVRDLAADSHKRLTPYEAQVRINHLEDARSSMARTQMQLDELGRIIPLSDPKEQPPSEDA